MAIDTIGANALATSAVTTAKIAADAVTSAKIPAGAVVASDVADGSVTTAKLADNAVTSAKALNLGRRNLVINGSMTNWQRGTSFSTNVYGCDRWKFYAPGSHANTRSTDTPDSPNNFKYSNSCGGSGDATGITQFIESGNCVHVPTSGSTKVILSFYLKHTTNSGTAKITSSVGTMDVADTSGATTTRSTQNHNTTTSWARYTHEMTGADLTAAATNGLQVTIKHNGSGTTLFLVTGVQIEIAEAATDYERQFAKDELEDCKRYFQRISGYRQGAYSSCMIAYSTSAAQGTLHLQTPMFSTPSITLEGAGMKLEDGGAGYTSSSTTVAGQLGSENHINWWIGGFSGLTDNNAYYAYGDDANHYIDLSAEL